jgi:nucleotide-binding universal stress UspA family protein
MYDTVLLPVDGSEGTAAAVEHAGDLAGKYDATVHVLSVVDTRNRFESPTGGIAPEAWENAEQERADEAIEAAVGALPEDVDVVRAVREGIPQSEILGYVDDADVDVVVMGTHGRTGIEHYLIGSVTEKVVRKSPVPVLTVRIDDED